MAKTELDVIEYIGKDAEQFERGIQFQDRRRRIEILDALLREAGRERVLDLGCSNGSWYSFFEDQGFGEIHGVELSPQRAEIARQKGYTVYNGHGQETPFEDDFFDVVVNQEVLVHVLQDEDRKAMIREARRILKPGGIYVLTIPPAASERRRHAINKWTGYFLLARVKQRFWGRHGRAERLEEEEFTRPWEIAELLAFLESIDFPAVKQVGHHFYFGDMTANFPPLQTLIDKTLGKLIPQAACVLFVKCVKSTR